MHKKKKNTICLFAALAEIFCHLPRNIQIETNIEISLKTKNQVQSILRPI